MKALAGLSERFGAVPNACPEMLFSVSSTERPVWVVAIFSATGLATEVMKFVSADKSIESGFATGLPVLAVELAGDEPASPDRAAFLAAIVVVA
jgi:hypothetical protein